MADLNSSKTPKTECEDLLNGLLPMAKKLLEKNHEFLPIAATLDPSGKFAFVGYYDGNEHPMPQELIQQYAEIFRAAAKEKKVKATGIAYDIRTVPPGAKEKKDAVAVQLDHVGGYSVIVVTPYELTDGEVKFDPPFATRGKGAIFGAPGSP